MVTETVPRYIKVNGKLYRQADADPLSDAVKQALDTLVRFWLSDRHTGDIIKKSFGHLPVDKLASLLADKFGVYLGDLAEVHVPWQTYAEELKSEKSKKDV